MSWIKMAFKYEGKCMVCNQMIKKNEMGFWSKGVGVKQCEQLEDPFISYKKAVVEKFPMLNIKI